MTTALAVALISKHKTAKSCVCPRCNGLMILQSFPEGESYPAYSSYVCVNCGNEKTPQQIQEIMRKHQGDNQMSAKIPYAELDQKTRYIVDELLNEDDGINPNTSTESPLQDRVEGDLPPVPPKPVTVSGHNRTAMGKYYKEHAELIKRYISVKGQRETKIAFGMSDCGFYNFLKRHGIVKEKAKRRDKRDNRNLTIIYRCDYPGCGARFITRDEAEKHAKLHDIPAYPDFDINMGKDVQIAWLENWPGNN